MLTSPLRAYLAPVNISLSQCRGGLSTGLRRLACHATPTVRLVLLSPLASLAAHQVRTTRVFAILSCQPWWRGSNATQITPTKQNAKETQRPIQRNKADITAGGFRSCFMTTFSPKKRIPTVRPPPLVDQNRTKKNSETNMEPPPLVAP